MKIIVFGGAGQLGQSIKKVAGNNPAYDITYLDAADGDITNPEVLDVVLTDIAPDAVINCAAYTAVDKAEDEAEKARLINVVGAGNLAEACHKHNCVLVHISTDFVFWGDFPRLLAEDMEARPLGVYGLTKLEGERAVAAACAKNYIVRTSWLYSEYGANFVKTMLRIAAGNDTIRVVADQVGTPTYAPDLAEAVFALLELKEPAYGLYHYSNEGAISWYDFAEAIFKIQGTGTTVVPITTEEYPTRASRPRWSVMDKRKFKGTTGQLIPHWAKSLKKCVTALNNQQ